MADYRTMFDRKYIFAYDLAGRDVTVTIKEVVEGKLVGEGGKESRKPIMYIEGKERGLGLCKTNCKTIAELYGTTDTREWRGKRVTLYPTKTMFGGKEVDCIRIRNVIPVSKSKAQAAPEPEQAEEGGDE